MRGPGQPSIGLADADVEEALGAVAAGRWVRLHGAVGVEVVLRAVGLAQARGVSALWVLDPADPAAGALDPVTAAGLAAVGVLVTGADDAGAALLRAAPRGLRKVALVPVTAATLGGLAGVAGVAAEVGASVEAWAGGVPELPSTAGEVGATTDVVAALDALVTRCAGSGVGIRAYGFQLPSGVPGPSDAVPPAVTPAVIDALRASLPLPSLAAGVRATDDLARVAAPVGDVADLGRLLGAVRWPVHELPRCAGGLGRGTGPRCAPCPGGAACGGGSSASAPAPWTGVGRGATVHVVAGFIADRILLQATLPGLVARLRALGATVRFDSCWEAPHNPHANPGGDPLADAEVTRHAHARAHAADFARALDLRGADLVVVPGWDWGDLVLRHPTLSPDARVVVADLHLLHGIDGWKRRWLPQGARSLVTSWWPSPRVHVHACFPGYARLYWYAGVPSSQLAWRPDPMHLDAWHAEAPAATCEGGVAAGNHLRDHAVLVDAARRLGAGPPLDVVGRVPPRGGGARLRPVPELPLPALRDRLAAARYVVVAVQHDPDRAAGISILAMAQALGRPVIATATPATLDHVRHGVDGLLVGAGDGGALAEAIARLDADDALVARLADGARAAAARASTDTWARELLDGVAPPTDVPSPRGPFAPW